MGLWPDPGWLLCSYVFWVDQFLALWTQWRNKEFKKYCTRAILVLILGWRRDSKLEYIAISYYGAIIVFWMAMNSIFLADKDKYKISFCDD